MSPRALHAISTLAEIACRAMTPWGCPAANDEKNVAELVRERMCRQIARGQSDITAGRRQWTASPCWGPESVFSPPSRRGGRADQSNTTLH